MSSEPVNNLPRGTVIADRYRILERIGEGAMGSVYRAEHVRVPRPLAVKVLHASVCNDPEIVARFEREAVATAVINHPNVVPAIDYGQLVDGSFFLVLEYVGGRSLRAEILEGPIETRRALRILRGTVSGVRAAHAAGVVHRDLKPDNIMLVRYDDDPDFVKVLDFGIAKVDSLAPGTKGAAAQPLTRMGSVFGTPDYMSPEQALGYPVDARTDLYSLGIILFEMLTGSRPFRGGAMTVLRERVLTEAPPELPPELAAQVDERAQAILRQLLRPAPDDRFQSADALRAAIDAVLATLEGAPAQRSPEDVGRRRPAPTHDETTEVTSEPPRESPRGGAIATVLTLSAPILRRPSRALWVMAGLVLVAGAVAGALTWNGNLGSDAWTAPRLFDAGSIPSAAPSADASASPSSVASAGPVAKPPANPRSLQHVPTHKPAAHGVGGH